METSEKESVRRARVIMYACMHECIDKSNRISMFMYVYRCTHDTNTHTHAPVYLSIYLSVCLSVKAHTYVRIHILFVHNACLYVHNVVE